MDYRELSIISPAGPGDSREAARNREHERRLNAESTFRLGFHTPRGELYLAVPRELSLRAEDVLRAEIAISGRLHGMPGKASRAVLRDLVLDEVVSSNALAQIRSTRRQVKDALDAAQGSPSAPNRFRELATLYLGIIDGTAAIPATPAGIRGIYEAVTRGEIPDDESPNGTLFRAYGVSIVQGEDRIVHSGLEPEGKIVAALEKMLEIARSPEIPSLYRSIAAHYLFEYIHPFYDGNGRTGRYLLSLMLGETLSPATAVSLSRTIAENREEYYRAFKTTENPENRGELTFFAHSLLGLVRKAQHQLEERLEGVS